MEKMKYQYSLELHKLGLCPVSDFTDQVVNRNRCVNKKGLELDPFNLFVCILS